MYNYTCCTDETVKNLITYSTRPIGILFTGNNESDPSLRMVPTPFARRYTEFDRPAARRFCIAFIARFKKSEGTFSADMSEKSVGNTFNLSMSSNGSSS